LRNPITQQRATTLRSSPTDAERHLWFHLRRKSLCGFRFRRQFPIGPFIADFACIEVKLVIELDGATWHDDPLARQDDADRQALLEAHGYRVRVAVDGLEALEKLKAEPADLVITDVMMPRMDGLQLLEALKKQRETEKIPVIMVTSLERREDQERGLSLGADSYIVKRKFDARELLDTVRQIL